MSERLSIRPGLEIAADDLQWRFTRAGGPGGQGGNTTDSRVQLSYDIGRLPEPYRSRALTNLAGQLTDDTVTVVASERRSQYQNRASATARLLATLRTATAPPPARRRPTKPTRSAVQNRLAEKRHRSEIKKLRRRNLTDRD